MCFFAHSVSELRGEVAERYGYPAPSSIQSSVAMTSQPGLEIFLSFVMLSGI